MHSYQQQFVSLLTAAIRNRKPDIPPDTKMEWTQIFEESRAHDVYSVLYSTVARLGAETRPAPEMLLEWQKITLSAGQDHIQHVEGLKDILRSFSDAHIPLILLKGLILRNLYPQPMLRSMVDADFLLREKDMDEAKRILTRFGYTQDSPEAKNIHFTHPTFIPIELHKNLVEHTHFPNAVSFEDVFWANAQQDKFEGIDVFIPAEADHILYLCLHMAEHMMSHGFGFRQLCDLVLLSEASSQKIRWDLMMETAEKLGIGHFTQILFFICHTLFNLDPSFITNPVQIEVEPLLQQFIQDIFHSGVFGRRDPTRHLGNQLLQYSRYSGTKKWPLAASYLFPQRMSMGARYRYVQKSVFLYPVAWFHRLGYNILNQRAFRQILEVLHPSDDSVSVYYERTKLLQWAGLKLPRD